MRLSSAFAIIGAPVVAVGLFLGKAGAEGELLIATVGTNDAFDIARDQDGRR